MKSSESKDKSLNKYIVISLQIIVIIIELLINSPIGILQSSSNLIKEENKLNDRKFGFIFCFISYFRLIGYILALIAMSINKKWSFAIFICVKSLILISFVSTKNIYLEYTLIAFSNCFHILPSIFIPLILNGLSSKSNQRMILGIYNFIFPFGRFLGYLLNYLMNYKVKIDF